MEEEAFETISLKLKCLTIMLGGQIWPHRKICLAKYLLFNGNEGWRWGKGGTCDGEGGLLASLGI